MNIFVIGNSLSFDTIPDDYATDYCIVPSQGLQSIYDNPSNPAVIGTRWDVAFAATSYDLISVQPYYVLTETDSIDINTTIISEWVTLQPNAKFIIHTGWAPEVNHDLFYQSTQTEGLLSWNTSYYEELISRLRTANPSTEFGVNPAINVNESINQDIKRGIGPFTALSDIYRDAIHMSLTLGRYMQNNLIRRTMGLPQTTENSSGFSNDIRLYLDTKVKSVVPIGVPFTEALGSDQTYSL